MPARFWRSFWQLLCKRQPASQGLNGFTVSVSSNGAYDIVFATPAWHFSGDTSSPLSNVLQADGSDALGPYSEVSFDYTAGETSRTIFGYAPSAPTATATYGDAGPVSYDSSTQRFTVEVTPGLDQTAAIHLSE